MSWVLILTSNVSARPPAVIGGYPSQEEAEAAGMLATRPIPREGRDWEEMPTYIYFTVVPGAAVDGPLGVTHSALARDTEDKSPGDPGYGKVIRHTYRSVANEEKRA